MEACDPRNGFNAHVMPIQTHGGLHLKLALDRRKLLMKDIADALGVSRAAICQLVNGSLRYVALCRRIDVYLGEAIFSGEYEFVHWNMVSELIGIDPISTPLGKLRPYARKMGVIGTKHMCREDLITRMVGICASKNKADRAGKISRSKTTIGALVSTLGPIPGIPSPSSPRRSAAKRKSQTS